MHNRIGFNRLDRKPSHRKSLHRNMVTSLIKHERIETTQAKAKEIRRTAEKLVTRAKVDSVHNRRVVAKTVYEKEALNKLFTEVGPRFADRPGGYTRILKLGRRSGDAAQMVILEFLRDDEDFTPKKKASAKKKPAAKPAKKVEAESVEEEKAEETAAEEAVAETAEAPVEEKKTGTVEDSVEEAPEAVDESQEGETE